MGVYADLRNFVLAHRTCAGSRHANAGPRAGSLEAPQSEVKGEGPEGAASRERPLPLGRRPDVAQTR